MRLGWFDFRQVTTSRLEWRQTEGGILGRRGREREAGCWFGFGAGSHFMEEETPLVQINGNSGSRHGAEFIYVPQTILSRSKCLVTSLLLPQFSLFWGSRRPASQPRLSELSIQEHLPSHSHSLYSPAQCLSVSWKQTGWQASEQPKSLCEMGESAGTSPQNPLKRKMSIQTLESISCSPQSKQALGLILIMSLSSNFRLQEQNFNFTSSHHLTTRHTPTRVENELSGPLSWIPHTKHSTRTNKHSLTYLTLSHFFILNSYCKPC